MRFFLILLISVLIVSCKGQDSSTTKPTLNQDENYRVNPDEVVLQLKPGTSTQSDDGWNTEVEVVRQMKAGFGFKKRLKPGEMILLYSENELPSNEFTGIVEFQEGPGDGTYILRALRNN